MYRATTEIAAAPEQVFTFLSDPERIRRWQPEVIESHPPEGGLHRRTVLRELVEAGQQGSSSSSKDS